MCVCVCVCVCVVVVVVIVVVQTSLSLEFFSSFYSWEPLTGRVSTISFKASVGFINHRSSLLVVCNLLWLHIFL